MRLFIAYPVPPQVATELNRVQAELIAMNRNTKITWTKSSAFHVTTHFLGDNLDQSILPDLAEVLEKISSAAPEFTFALSMISAFPDRFRPKTIIATLADLQNTSGKIQRSILSHLARVGITSGIKPWHPHITIARNRGDGTVIGLDKVRLLPLSWRVQNLELIQSELLQDGPKYITLGRYDLKHL